MQLSMFELQQTGGALERAATEHGLLKIRCISHSRLVYTSPLHSLIYNVEKVSN